MTRLQRRTLEYLATVDTATTREIEVNAPICDGWKLMGRLIAAGHARNVSTTRRCVYRITLQGRQAIAPPLVFVAWKDGRSAPLKPATAEALRVRLEAEMGPGSHWVVRS